MARKRNPWHLVGTPSSWQKVYATARLFGVAVLRDTRERTFRQASQRLGWYVDPWKRQGEEWLGWYTGGPGGRVNPFALPEHPEGNYAWGLYTVWQRVQFFAVDSWFARLGVTREDTDAILDVLHVKRPKDVPGNRIRGLKQIAPYCEDADPVLTLRMIADRMGEAGRAELMARLQRAADNREGEPLGPLFPGGPLWTC